MSKYKIREELNPEINCHQSYLLQITHIKRKFHNEPGVGHKVKKKKVLMLPWQVLNIIIYFKWDMLKYQTLGGLVDIQTSPHLNKTDRQWQRTGQGHKEFSLDTCSRERPRGGHAVTKAHLWCQAIHVQKKCSRHTVRKRPVHFYRTRNFPSCFSKPARNFQKAGPLPSAFYLWQLPLSRLTEFSAQRAWRSQIWAFPGGLSFFAFGITTAFQGL